MHKACFQFPGLLTTVAIVLSACNMPAVNATSEATAQAEQSATKDVSLIELTATQTEVIPTDTPTVTPTETMTPEPSATATPEPPMAKVVRESNCRIGPGELYELVAKYQVGQILEVAARDLGSSYLFVRNPEKPEEQCYLLAQNMTITGETTALPRYTPPPSPTAAPYFNLTFKKFEACNGVDFAVFTVENTGSTPFRSAYIKVINQKANLSVEQALDAFDLRVKCVLAKNIAPLEPGGTGYVASPPFKWSGHGSKLRAVIMLCTEKNLKGSCVTQTTDIKE
ncbi:MAG TPA: hypothetical protein VFQ13_16430 [Anaerolineales bacterium]|nr:hypothetical protein [Anaerolineales bacterium]